jgi:anti-sigma factor RsiW
MSTVLEIEDAIEQLKPVERAQVAAWLARKEAQDWDAQMDFDAASGKLDFLFREADNERKSGQPQNWPPPK